MAKIGIRSIALSFMLFMLAIITVAQIGKLLDSPILSFISNAQGNRDIYLLDARTRQRHNFTQSPLLEEWSVVWSRDGSQVIYNVVDSGDDLYIMDAVGRHRRQVQGLQTMQAFNLTWSNDGQTLAYFSSYQNTSDLYLISLTDNTVTNMTNSPDISEGSPEWSPDGSKLLFMMYGDIYLHHLQNNRIQRMTNTPMTEEYPVWSPDSSQIIFQGENRSDGKRSLYHLTVATGAIQMLDMPIPPREQPISWSPDNQQITLTLNPQQIITLDVDSGAIQSVTDGTQRTSGAVWSPDGQFIAYIENRYIQIYDLQHTKTLQLDLDMTVVPPLVWQP